MKRENLHIGVTEIFQFAIKMEENGEAFYRKVAQTTGDKKVKELFTFLAGEELDHKKTFEKMLPEAEKYEPPEAYPSEYLAYLRAYADNIVFTPQVHKDLPEKPDAVSAVEFGIRRELESIAYFQEIRGFVPANQRNLIDKITEEERAHFVKFSDLKKTTIAGGDTNV